MDCQALFKNTHLTISYVAWESELTNTLRQIKILLKKKYHGFNMHIFVNQKQIKQKTKWTINKLIGKKESNTVQQYGF